MRIALVVIAALLVGACVVAVLAVVQPFQDDDEQAPAEVSVDAIVATPPLWYREAVEVTARAVPLDEERFVLEGDEQAIIVQPQPDAVAGEVQRGERVTVRGFVYWLDRLQVAALRPLLRNDSRPRLAEAPTELGDPYISAEYVDARTPAVGDARSGG